MESNRYDKGIEVLQRMVSEETLNATVKKMEKFSPDMAKLIVEFPYGSLYSRPGLDLKQRSLLTIGAMIASGAAAQLDFHIQGALNAGLTPNEIVEAVMHCVSYAGFPKTLDAMFVVMKVFDEQGITYEEA
ncbi:carboxymuconolactone decarboxylase [Paenibacillus rhizosphaerae]|uniref:Carboxymuconolactone decarboxylase n=2 Tax=Paenibacillus TaxID=44249 RepID=A0A1R1F405_9BACL|nr:MULTISPECIES: carboxymuconolactone decarboxylase family protein [Paenibacillus]MBJ9993523.1 carboxymuconolactone decarboxylase family protein [Paenibacillus sp. S28]OMF58839.1 carboxymuconolactone decarboxylase [Paenibacillus rhizosphaerae]RED41810.1 4-carboxymuconolactone decarboxylase [Paenibacillus sp. VMFN-D1]GIO52793.1 4-carboxymuconolactone decarboxylase [Paenibacillus cineris]GIO61526.1 4-carboxymuconolactone decarboxylase [Paenibacillus cineris]